MSHTEVVIVSAARSAVARGKKDGGLASVHPIDLSATVMKAVAERVRFDTTLIDDVIWGCAMPEAGQGLNHARMAALRAGSSDRARKSCVITPTLPPHAGSAASTVSWNATSSRVFHS